MNKKPITTPSTDPLAGKLDAIREAAKKQGIDSYMLLVKHPDGSSTFRFEKLKVSDAINMSGNAWQKSVQMEIESNPNYTAQYRAIFETALKDFKALVGGVNKKIAKFSGNTPE